MSSFASSPQRIETGTQVTYRFNRIESLVAESFDAGEPLIGGTENCGFLGSPVVRVLVIVIFCEQQRPLFFQRIDDGHIPIAKDIHAFKSFPGFNGEPSQVIDGRQQFQSVLQSS